MIQIIKNHILSLLEKNYLNKRRGITMIIILSKHQIMAAEELERALELTMEDYLSEFHGSQSPV